MDTPIAPPLRLSVTEPAREVSHAEVASSIRTFLQQYTARSGSSPASVGLGAEAGTHASSTSAQLSRLAENVEKESSR
ncbi:unnamed protein product [Tilletia controversa]|uniref:Uncharacterized protein n=2 Tax=Tilletia TaxID=13289 RepID=A0A9N8M909_9BASI|nr:unnamed protein product [Tilletia caries]CAD6933580.1 unnamed protein product [Tilletia controversa]CAD6950402.1 unnamed protein product [Tilletia laevis]CAD6899073.1 unnamed protein product [Tilletia caries]CAD6948449.1 unnamed protein product [Tilletia caries]